MASDDDYKVRAAVARTIASVSLPDWAEQLKSLIADVNWHVRASVLRGLLGAAVDPRSDPTAMVIVTRLADDDERWREAPDEAARLRHRLLLLAGLITVKDTAAQARALFGLLREVRTAWTAVPESTLEQLVAEGHRSPRWLVRREADAIEIATRARAAQPGQQPGWRFVRTTGDSGASMPSRSRSTYMTSTMQFTLPKGCRRRALTSSRSVIRCSNRQACVPLRRSSASPELPAWLPR